MPKRFKIKSYNKLYKLITLLINITHFIRTNYTNDKPLADVFKFKKTSNFIISYSSENSHVAHIMII